MQTKADDTIQFLLNRFLTNPEAVYTREEEEILSTSEVFKECQLEDKTNLFDLVRQDNYKLFQIASMKGYLGVIQCLLIQEPELKKLEHCGRLFVSAAANGRLQIVKLLTEEVPELMQSAKFKSEVALFASVNGHYNVIHFLTTINQYFQNRMVRPAQKQGLESYRRWEFSKFCDDAFTTYLPLFKPPTTKEDSTQTELAPLPEIRNIILKLVFEIEKLELGLLSDVQEVESSDNLKSHKPS